MPTPANNRNSQYTITHELNSTLKYFSWSGWVFAKSFKVLSVQYRKICLFFFPLKEISEGDTFETTAVIHRDYKKPYRATTMTQPITFLR